MPKKVTIYNSPFPSFLIFKGLSEIVGKQSKYDTFWNLAAVKFLKMKHHKCDCGCKAIYSVQYGNRGIGATSRFAEKRCMRCLKKEMRKCAMEAINSLEKPKFKRPISDWQENELKNREKTYKEILRSKIERGDTKVGTTNFKIDREADAETIQDGAFRGNIIFDR